MPAREEVEHSKEHRQGEPGEAFRGAAARLPVEEHSRAREDDAFGPGEREQEKERVDPGGRGGGSSMGGDRHFEDEEHVERRFQAGEGVHPEIRMKGQQEDSEQRRERSCGQGVQAVEDDAEAGRADELEEQRRGEVQQRGNDAEEGVDGAGVGLLMWA